MQKLRLELAAHTEKRYRRKGNARFSKRRRRVEELGVRLQLRRHEHMEHGILRAGVALRRKGKRRTHGLPASRYGKQKFRAVVAGQRKHRFEAELEEGAAVFLGYDVRNAAARREDIGVRNGKAVGAEADVGQKAGYAPMFRVQELGTAQFAPLFRGEYDHARRKAPLLMQGVQSLGDDLRSFTAQSCEDLLHRDTTPR